MLKQGLESLIVDVANELRSRWKFADDEHRGRRFDDNARLVSLIQQRHTNEQVEDAPFSCVHHALRELAQADFHYLNEKEYGDGPVIG